MVRRRLTRDGILLWTRDGVLLAAGVSFAFYEVVVRGFQGLPERPYTLVFICGLCFGIPIFLRGEERKREEEDDRS